MRKLTVEFVVPEKNADKLKQIMEFLNVSASLGFDGYALMKAWK